MSHYLFDLPNIDERLSPSDVLRALDFWRSYPSNFNRYASFSGTWAKTPTLVFVVRKDGQVKERLSLIYKPSNIVDQTVTFMGHDEPTELVQFYARIPNASYTFSGFGYQDLVFGNSDSSWIGSTIGHLRPDGDAYLLTVNRFQLPEIHQSFQKLLAKELELRGIDSRSFIKSSDICRAVALKYQRFWTVNCGIWSNCMNMAKFAKEFPQDTAFVVDAETSCAQLEAKLNAEIARRFDAFIMSARGVTSTKSFQDWAGGGRVTLAIVFTDVVGSTALGEEIRDEAMNEVRRAHFAQSRQLIDEFQGRTIKTIGDSFMAAFKDVGSALEFARELQRNTGHQQVRIRAGIHIGPMDVEEEDVHGGTVNFAARVVAAIEDAEIWLSDQAKQDIDRLRAVKHKHLKWEPHESVPMKGFQGKFTLWAMVPVKTK